MDTKTIDTYDRLAKEYDDETAGFWEEFPHSFVEAFRDALGTGIVLDVGSGPGRDALLLRDIGLSVTCLDASHAMVKMTDALGFESVLGDFAKLPFEDGKFDGIWAYTSLLHVPKSEVGESLAEIARVIKPGGILALGLIEGDRESYRESSGVPEPRWFSLYKQDEVEKLLNAHGFEIFHFSTFTPRSRTYLHFLGRKA